MCPLFGFWMAGLQVGTAWTLGAAAVCTGEFAKAFVEKASGKLDEPCAADFDQQTKTWVKRETVR